MKSSFINPTKSIVRQTICENFEKGEYTTLIGPNLGENLECIERYITNANKTSPIYLYELDEDTYKGVDIDLQILKLRNGNTPFLSSIKLYNLDVIAAKPTKSMNLDFCDAFKTRKNTIISLFTKQLDYEITRGRHASMPTIKAFTITCSCRSPKASISDFINWRKTLDIHNTFYIKPERRIGTKIGHSRSDRPYFYMCEVYSSKYIKYNRKLYIIEDEFIIKYRADAGSMFTWFIKYKNK